MGKSVLLCFAARPTYSDSLFAGNSSQLGILDLNLASLICQICFQTCHSALQCPHFPYSVGPTPDSLASHLLQ